MHLDIEVLRSIFEDNKFSEGFVPRDCPNTPDDCFGQAFGTVLDPFIATGFWQSNDPEMVALYNGMYAEPEFSLISEHIVEALNSVVYKELTEQDCEEDYFKESKGDKRRGLANKKPHTKGTGKKIRGNVEA